LASADELDVAYPRALQGGLAVAGSSVSTTYDGTELYFSGPELEVAMPPTATVRAAVVVLHAKNRGFLGDEEDWVKLTGLPLHAEDEVGSGTRYRALAVDAAEYGSVGPGSYSWEEAAVVEDACFDGSGLGGVTLAIAWEDRSVRARRQVTFASAMATRRGSSSPWAG
jgi:hypothetical protein